MRKSRRITTFILLIAVLLTSCSSAEATPQPMEVQNKINAAVAQTLAALSTQVASVKPTDGPKETPVDVKTEAAPTGAPATPAAQTGVTLLPPTPTLPKPTNVPGACTDYGAYVADITIPDGTMVPPGTQFTKTWSIRNTGSCTWTPEYNLVWIGGDIAGNPNRVPLTTTNVLPGQTVHVSVNLTAPTEFKKYRSFWKIMNKDGSVFGLMDNYGKEQSIWAEIVVGLKYSFISNMCSATFTSSSGVLPCPGIQKDPRGFAYINTAPAIEGGVKENNPALVMVPPSTKGGYIVAQYPPIIISEGANLVTFIGCLEGYTKCNVRFRITYSIDGGPEQELVNRIHGFGEWERLSINLTQNNMYAMMNRSVAFLFYVTAMDGSQDNYAFFFSPVITP
jgi:hypothetical protein